MLRKIANAILLALNLSLTACALTPSNKPPAPAHASERNKPCKSTLPANAMPKPPP